MTNKQKGIIAILVAAFGFAFMSIFVKLSGDIPVEQKVLFRNVVSMMVSAIMITFKKGTYIGKKENRKKLLLRSSLGTIGMLFFFYSITHMVTSDANMINKLSAFFLILFSFWFLKERVSKKQIIAIIFAFIGTIFIIKPSFNFDFVPYLTSILAAAFAGGAYTVLRTLGNKEHYTTVVFFFSTFSVLILLPFVVYGYVFVSKTQLLYLCLTGVFATIGQFGTTLAYKYAPAKEISIFSYFTVVFVTVMGIPLLKEYPDIYSIIGYVIIFISAYSISLPKKET